MKKVEEEAEDTIGGSGSFYPYWGHWERNDASRKRVYILAKGGTFGKRLVGKKALNLYLMQKILFPVPATFIIDSRVCREFVDDSEISEDVMMQCRDAIRAIENSTNSILGCTDASKRALLLAIRTSGQQETSELKTVLYIGI